MLPRQKVFFFRQKFAFAATRKETGSGERPLIGVFLADEVTRYCEDVMGQLLVLFIDDGAQGLYGYIS